MIDLYRLVYASKNLIGGNEDDGAAAVVQILSTSQRNNAASDVTGTLLFDKGAFAQVLEGPQRSVEETFERIQQDDRHSEVTVLQCGPAEWRAFGNWSMAFVGRSSRSQALWNDLAAQSGFDLTRMNGGDVFAMLHGLVVEEEGIVPSRVAPPLSRSRFHHATPDVGRLRADLADRRADVVTTSKDAKSDVVAASVSSRDATLISEEDSATTVLRASLRSERLTSIELRDVIDELRIALAHQAERIREVSRERDAWAERVRILATALCEEVETVTSKSSAPLKAAA